MGCVLIAGVVSNGRRKRLESYRSIKSKQIGEGIALQLGDGELKPEKKLLFCDFVLHKRGFPLHSIIEGLLMLPPGVNENLLANIPLRYREDAQQEAWVGFLEAQRDGLEPVEAAKKAVWDYANRERSAEKLPENVIEALRTRAVAKSRNNN